jgi:hypothetical protein
MAKLLVEMLMVAAVASGRRRREAARIAQELLVRHQLAPTLQAAVRAAVCP